MSNDALRERIADAITYHPGNRGGTPEQRHLVSLELADTVLRVLRPDLDELEQLRTAAVEGSGAASAIGFGLPVHLGRRNRITDDHLRAVAEVYRKADGQGLPPTRAVADRFTVPHSTAAKWVGHARRRGILGPTASGKAGEQR